MEDEQKLAQIEARREPLENELYGAELDLKLAKKGSDKQLTEGPQQRVDEIKEKLKVLDEEAAGIS